ncbi:polysaccharide deacetylase family protein [Sorangium sp. So ce185]|uniref:polysaccharide deacetylase family protein n=1 Tax=Sorangium sp. So ce185 TaxID=3133287 RepID=UPI003F63CA54
MEKHGVKGTAALNADVCRYYPRIIEGGNALGWEWMAHGTNNSTLINGQSEEEERQLIGSVIETVRQSTGQRPRGWLSPGLTESHRTLDLLAAAGIEYVANWVNDEQPYPMRVKSGSVLSLPYSVEINDYTAFLEQGQSGETFGRMICDQFDVLYEDGARSGRVMAICLHPFLSGHTHRSKYLARALAHITSRREVWVTTGGEIADWYNTMALPRAVR